MNRYKKTNTGSTSNKNSKQQKPKKTKSATRKTAKKVAKTSRKKENGLNNNTAPVETNSFITNDLRSSPRNWRDEESRGTPDFYMDYQTARWHFSDVDGFDSCYCISSDDDSSPESYTSEKSINHRKLVELEATETVTAESISYK